MKRIISFLLAMLMLTSLCVGCTEARAVEISDNLIPLTSDPGYGTITYFYDWNGINNLFGPSLSSSNYCDENGTFTLTGENLLVRYLNWNGEDKLVTSTQADLDSYWSNNTFDGYTFKGWATTADAATPNVFVGSKVANGQSLYAVWTKGDQSNVSFARVDPESGPIESLKIEGNLDFKLHATPGASITLTAAYTPVRACNVSDIVWTLNGAVKVFAGNPYSNADYTLTATENKLTITANSTNTNSLSIGVSANGVNGFSPAKVTTYHDWVEQYVEGELTCTTGTDTVYTCSCGAIMKKHQPQLEHVYSSMRYAVLKELTCTEDGIKQLICLRCGEQCGNTGRIPATGHDWTEWSVTIEPTYDNEGQEEKNCTVCGATEFNTIAKLIPIPTPVPTATPTPKPTETPIPTAVPTAVPTAKPTETAKPTAVPTVKPTTAPVVVPKPAATAKPTAAPTAEPVTTTEPVAAPAEQQIPIVVDNVELPTVTAPPTAKPTDAPIITAEPTQAPVTPKPTAVPAKSPAKTQNVGSETPATANPKPTAAVKQLATPKITKLENTTKGIKITWGKISGAAKYRIYYKVNGKWKKLADTSSTSYTWKKANSGVKYTFTVRCISKDGKTTTSSYNKTGKTITFLSSPQMKKIAKVKKGISISWTKVTGAAKYRVYYRTGNGKWKKLTDTTKTSFTWTKPKNNTKYYFTVRCVSKDGKTFTSAYNTKGTYFKYKK